MLHLMYEYAGESHCCGAAVYGETKICGACKEHCEVEYLNDEEDENMDT